MTTKHTITRRIQFCAGHRVFKHESKCAHPHGHNYVLYATFKKADSDSLDEVGRVIDFSIIKSILGGWIDANWDHGFLVYADDYEMLNFLLDYNHKHYKCSFNPTAENMAEYLYTEICPHLFEKLGIRCTKIKLHETENCSATYPD